MLFYIYTHFLIRKFPGKDCVEEQWNITLLEKYHELLTHSIKGFGIVLTRDVDECWINKYNSEFLEIWNGNIDVALVFDMYAVVTYIADYYMKVS